MSGVFLGPCLFKTLDSLKFLVSCGGGGSENPIRPLDPGVLGPFVERAYLGCGPLDTLNDKDSIGQAKTTQSLDLSLGISLFVLAEVARVGLVVLWGLPGV